MSSFSSGILKIEMTFLLNNSMDVFTKAILKKCLLAVSRRTQMLHTPKIVWMFQRNIFLILISLDILNQ